MPKHNPPKRPGSPTFIAVREPGHRATWSGLIQFALVAVPVKAYPVIRADRAFHLNQLHAGCGQRIGYEKHCPRHGKLDSSSITSGYEYAPGHYVVVEEEELEQLRPACDKAIVFQQFLGADEVDPRLFAGRAWYLIPDGTAAQRSYVVHYRTMALRQRSALAQGALHGSRRLVLVRPATSLLVMYDLHFPEAVRAEPPHAANLGEHSVSDEEQRLASLLVDAVSDPVDWSRYRDETVRELKTLIEAKIAGRALAAPADDPIAVLPLLDALRQSVAALPTEPKTTKPKTKGGKPRDECAVPANAGHARRAL
ncbi:MAG: Ku protein [Gemmataceae bacterium]